MSQNDLNTPTCPKCKKVIVSDDINVANDVAYCRSCNLAHKLSGLIHSSELADGTVLHEPPAGVRLINDGLGRGITATHRSFGAALGTLAMALFWNGIVSVFVLLAMSATLSNLNIPVPDWFPAPNMNDSPMGPGVTIFLWIFLTPFIVIGLGMMGAFLMSIGGKTEVRLNHKTGKVFTGVWPLGYRRRFEVSSVFDVRIEAGRWRDSDGTNSKTYIIIETHGGKVIKFGSMLSEERRKFIAVWVYQILM